MSYLWIGKRLGGIMRITQADGWSERLSKLPTWEVSETGKSFSYGLRHKLVWTFLVNEVDLNSYSPGSFLSRITSQMGLLNQVTSN